MIVNQARTSPFQGTSARLTVASSERPTEITDRLSLSGAGGTDKKKLGNAIAWTGFGVQCIGAGITLTSGGWGGVGIFAVGAAMVVAGELMKRKG